MNKTIVLLAAIALLLGLSGCDMSNGGYPDSVKFPRNGGTKIINGDGYDYFLQIMSHDGKLLAESKPLDLENPRDSIIVSYQWLTVKGARNSTQIELIADPEKWTNERFELWTMHQNTVISTTVSMK